jgi:uncharacterized protein
MSYSGNENHKQGYRYFTSPSSGKIGLNGIVSEVSRFVDKDPSGFYSLIIGTDSQTRRINGIAEIDFVSAIVVYRKGKGAIYFWRKEKRFQPPVLREKIYTETVMSLELAHKLVPKIRKVISPAKYDLEIHIDVGPLGPTREMIREVVGMVNGNGFKAKTKPDSWGASSVADKHA